MCTLRHEGPWEGRRRVDKGGPRVGGLLVLGMQGQAVCIGSHSPQLKQAVSPNAVLAFGMFLHPRRSGSLASSPWPL
jgi:hypothetical protein